MDVFFPLTRQAGGIRMEPCLSGCLFWMLNLAKRESIYSRSRFEYLNWSNEGQVLR